MRVFHVYAIGDRDGTTKIKHEAGGNVDQDGVRGDSQANEPDRDL